MLWDVSRRNEQAWQELSKTMGEGLRQEIMHAPTGVAMRQLMEDQVALITSLPLEAAQRVHRLVTEGLTDGDRGKSLVQEIMRTGDVTRSRAICIARTETSRASSVLTQARAQYVGSDSYIWRTANDALVRLPHRLMEGRVCSWANPPVVEKGKPPYHAGCIYNCFTGDTLVTHEDPIRVFRAFYNGPLVILKTGNTTVRVTPNHPIITTCGVVPAGSLKPGQNVLQMEFQPGNTVMADVDHKQVTFQHLFESDRFVVEAIPRAVFNLYGDAVQQHVDVVTHKSNLALHGSYGFQGIREEMVSSANSRVKLFGAVRIFAEVIKTLDACLLGMIHTLLGGPVVLNNLVSLCACAEWNTVAFEHFHDSSMHGFIPSGQGSGSHTTSVKLENFLLRQLAFIIGFVIFARTGQTQFPEFAAQQFIPDMDNFSSVPQGAALLHKAVCITDVSFEDYFGHVYTMETVKGYYGVSTAMFASKNCRCWPEPVIPDKFR
jgi:SPP1 gp7 family putative phage head morphogenesis protein